MVCLLLKTWVRSKFCSGAIIAVFSSLMGGTDCVQIGVGFSEV